MNDLKTSYRSPLLYAIGLHVFVILFLIIHFSASTNSPSATPQVGNVIKAVAVTQAQLPQQQSAPAPVPVVQQIQPVVVKPKPVTQPAPLPQQQVQRLQNME